MADTRLLSTALDARLSAHDHRRPFDQRTSRRLDEIQSQLDQQPAGIRRRWLLLCKRWHERHVIALYYEVR